MKGLHQMQTWHFYWSSCLTNCRTSGVFSMCTAMEDMDAQERSVDLFRRLGDDTTYLYALVHMDVIRRFGRFPHRNAALGRETTEAESAYLADGGFSA